jgi:Putative phage tail protein/SprB repeat
MPQAVVLVAVKAVSYIAASKILSMIAINLVLSAAARALAPRAKQPSAKIDVEYTGTMEPRRIIYGKMKVAGMNVIPPMTSGTNSAYLHQVLAVATHECNSLGTVYFNETAVGTITAVTGTADDGKVTTGAFSNKAWVRRYTGTDAQTVDYILTTDNPFQWTSAHRGRGVAYIAIKFEFDQNVYKSSKPEVTCLVEGAKVYDPRLDSTQTTIPGAGTQRVNDSTTWTYSTNPALCLTNYLIASRYGMEESTSRIDFDLVADAADICDETVSIPGSTTQKRYTINCVLDTFESFQSNIQTIVSAMQGVCYYSGGKWRMFAGAWSASAFSITDADLVDAGIDVTTAYPYNDRWNAVRGSFLDTTRNYQLVEFEPIVSATYVTDDGEQAWRDMPQPTCASQYEAQRNAIVMLRKSRNGQSAVVRCGMSAWKVRPFETGTVTISELGWSAKTVRCESWRFDQQGFVELVLREEASTDWSDPAVGDYVVPGTITSPTPGTYTPAPPTALTANGLAGLIQFSWTTPSVVPTGAAYQLYEYTASTPFASATLIWTGSSTNTVIAKTDTTTRYYWVRLLTSDGGTSSTNPTTTGLAAAAATISTALNAAASPSSLSTSGTGTPLTTASTTVTPTGGTSPYTYAWARLSGSTSITANTASAASTTFTGASLASGTTYTAVFRCTVTDNVAATKTVDVNVEIIRLAMTASASPTYLYKTGPTASQTTASVTVTPSGGVSPYTYAWTLLSGSALTVNSPTAATTTFSKTGMISGDSFDATYRCTVTDSTGGTPLTATADVPVTIERT